MSMIFQWLHHLSPRQRKLHIPYPFFWGSCICIITKSFFHLCPELKEFLFSLCLRSYMQDVVTFTMGASWVPHPTLTLLRLDRELRDFGRRGFHMSHTPLISPCLLMGSFLLLLTNMSRSSVTISMRRLLDKAHSSTRYDCFTMFYISCTWRHLFRWSPPLD